MELTIFETEKKTSSYSWMFRFYAIVNCIPINSPIFFSLSFIPMQFLNNNSQYTVLRVTLHLLHKNPSILNIYDRLLWFRYWQMQTIGLKICLVSIKSRFVLHANRFWTFFRLSEKWKKKQKNYNNEKFNHIRWIQPSTIFRIGDLKTVFRCCCHSMEVDKFEWTGTHKFDLQCCRARIGDCFRRARDWDRIAIWLLLKIVFMFHRKYCWGIKVP